MTTLWMSDGYLVVLKMYMAGQIRNAHTDTCSSATWSITNPMWTDLGANPGLGGEKPAANPMRQGTCELPQTDRQTRSMRPLTVSECYGMLPSDSEGKHIGGAGEKYLMLTLILLMWGI